MTEPADQSDVGRSQVDSLSMPSVTSRSAHEASSGGSAGGIWVTTLIFAAILMALILLISQNLQQASVHFLGVHGQWPIGGTLMLSALLGMLLVAVPVAALRLRPAAHALQDAAGVPEVAIGMGLASPAPGGPVRQDLGGPVPQDRPPITVDQTEDG